VAPRAGATLAAALAPLRERYGDRFEVLTDFQMDISSSAVRARIARGDAGAGLVPAAVAHYIKTHRLYQQ
jgi:nicotinic acid mononucleotide adenylyltransferase